MRLALGTVQFGLPYGVSNHKGQVIREEAEAMLLLARSVSIDTLDTAIAYGEAETLLGLLGVSGFRVISKIPPLPEHVGSIDDWIVAQVESSLSRLRVSHLHGLMLHSPDDLLGPYGEKIARGLNRVKNLGLVERIGLSVYSPEQLSRLIHLLPLEVVQIPFNIFDRRFAESGWLDRLVSDGVEVHARSAFLQGLLLMPIELVPHKFAPFRKFLEQWHGWVADQVEARTPVQACLAHVASYAGIARIVVGAENSVQLNEIISASKSSPCRAPASLASTMSSLINPSEWGAL